MTDYGIDIASHQGDRIDWNQVAGHNITYCSVKTTEGTTYTNPLAAAQVEGARSVGIAVGGYHYAHPGNLAAQVGRFAASLHARGLLAEGSMWPMLDIEENSLGDPNPFVAEFITRFRAATGAPLLVYANQNWFTRLLRPHEWADDRVLLWVAQYNGDPGRPDYSHPRLALHQHTSSGNVHGFPKPVDRNATLPGWSRDAFILGTPPTPAPQQPAPAPTGWVPYVIAPGDTLSAIAARTGTTVAELANRNGIPDPNLIHAGRTIQVPASGGAGGGERYQIRPGDTLSAIAARWGTTVAAIASRNNIADPNRIYAGDWLTRP
ncbi:MULTISPECIES: LysM peptidoglycan-binding domain-containing protein [Actinosynnema]|uniref:LysM peptidoglycan-binding domain-containing protein n=1 Tax=Actinosynnema TaxID=40566 RepID=UPI0020A432C2|nr:LysM peptidoglycan-binding domain-containing protein [Actinosynnema pretiosum]MCP2092653.1 lysozyme [Actinosynnema pretiosum]